MIVSYCKKCKLESAGVVCTQCGKKAPAASVRDIWRTVRVPVADGGAWRSIITALLFITALLLVLLLGTERLLNTAANFALFANQVLTYVLLTPVVGVGVAFLALSLQGREEVRYSLDTVGTHIQVWHRYTRLRSISRLLSPNKKATVAAQDGTLYIMAYERHLLWQDVNAIKYFPSMGVIRLYHTPYLAPIVLRIPLEEYDTAEAVIKKYAKLKD